MCREGEPERERGREETIKSSKQKQRGTNVRNTRNNNKQSLTFGQDDLLATNP